MARSPYPSSHRRQSFFHVVSIDELVHQMNSGWLLLNGKELCDIRVSETRTNSYLGHNQAQHLSLSVLRYFDCFHGNVGACPMSSKNSSERSLSQCMCCIDVQLLHQNRMLLVPMYVSMFNSSTRTSGTETQGLSIWSTLAGASAAWSCAG